jgi:hypothetical protein
LKLAPHAIVAFGHDLEIICDQRSNARKGH